MATVGFVESLLGGLAADVKRPLLEVMRYVLPNSRWGPVEHQAKTESFQGYYQSCTTATSTGEFDVVHGMGRTPYVAVPVVPLNVIGARLVPLTVTRAADGQRAYFKTEAGSTNAPFFLYLE